MPVVTFVYQEITVLIALGVSDALKTTLTHLSQVVGQRIAFWAEHNGARLACLQDSWGLPSTSRFLGGEEGSQEVKSFYI